jgi:hypothetical protein
MSRLFSSRDIEWKRRGRWVDGASLQDTPRHMLVHATVLVREFGFGQVVEFTKKKARMPSPSRAGAHVARRSFLPPHPGVEAAARFDWNLPSAPTLCL